MTETPEAVLEFWFTELTPKDWFVKSESVDHRITERFANLHLALSRNISEEWRATPEARLALVIVFDQFPRNIYRGSPMAFATDGLALKEAKAALAVGADKSVAEDRRIFFYMPFEHAEDLGAQERSVALFEALGHETYLDYARRHHDVIAQYGRFPHRNPILGRTSTAEEKAYLSEPGAGF
ncbi:DUF924 domain-containing protein [Hoeflea sp. YIM 152468]|uniref:DUF924 family protein n=1 Tax=Hoeflea sp. YIM 152468 TaxID=3031759 RepID=UPI0023DCB43A|nr:DUF924 family protein [Hoeflea sp. YIM 152468]MDF1607583.1 DUF924 domain-containing protein [Hoeflea sp. YIM 152468]